MEDRMERLEHLVEELMEEVRECKDLLKMAVRRGVLKVRRSNSLKVLGIKDLSGGELEVLELFLDWARGKWVEWERGYEEGKIEGYDSRRGWILLRKGTVKEFLDMASDLGYSKQEVLGMLGDLGVLKYWERGKVKQYCISVRIDRPVKTKVSGYYVLDFERLQGVSQELRSLSSEEAEGNSEAVED